MNDTPKPSERDTQTPPKRHARPGWEWFWRKGRPGGQVVCHCSVCDTLLGSPGSAHWCERHQERKKA